MARRKRKRLPQSGPGVRTYVIAIPALAASLLFGVGTWATNSRLSGAVVAPGAVVIENSSKKIQHLTGGIVRRIAVTEGARVHAGDILISLDATLSNANLAIIEQNLARLYIQRARLHAEQDGTGSFTIPDAVAKFCDINADALFQDEKRLFASRREAQEGMKAQLLSRRQQLAEQISGLEVELQSFGKALALLKEDRSSAEALLSKGLMTRPRLLALQQSEADLEGQIGEKTADKAAAQAKISETNLQVLQLEQDQRKDVSEQISKSNADIAEYEQKRLATIDQIDHLDIRSPVDGTVSQLTIHSVNEVVAPGQVIMVVVPTNRQLTVETQILPSSIDQIHLGQSAKVRFTAFSQTTTPAIEGTVTRIAPDVVKDDKTGKTYYPVMIGQNISADGDLAGLALYPGMPAEVFIESEDRSVISYLMKPLTDQMQRAMREE